MGGYMVICCGTKCLYRWPLKYLNSVSRVILMCVLPLATSREASDEMKNLEEFIPSISSRPNANISFSSGISSSRMSMAPGIESDKQRLAMARRFASLDQFLSDFKEIGSTIANVGTPFRFTLISPKPAFLNRFSNWSPPNAATVAIKNNFNES
jgi:hypothetical protein